MPQPADPQGREVPTRDLHGLAYSDLDLPATLRLLAERPAEAPFAYVVTPNAQHIVRLSRGDPDFRAGYAGAWLRLIDSRVLQLLARPLFGRHLPLVRGSDLTAELLEEVIRPDDPITVIGGDAVLLEALHRRFGLSRIAHCEPPMGLLRDPAARRSCVDFVLAHPGRFVFLAVGAPQSERIAAEIGEAGGASGVGLCIGSSLHFACGLVPRAPHWMRWAGLEWAFRLLLAPRRHFRRVFGESLPLLWLLLRARLGGRLLRD